MIRRRPTTPTGSQACVVAALAIIASVVLGAGPAGSQITGGCSATIDGRDVDAARSVRSAIEVGADDTIVVSGQAPGPITGYDLYLAFAGIRFPAASGSVDSGDTSYTRTVDIADYAAYGVGLYRVEGETTGTPCSAWGYVKVTGRFPLFTAAGAAGAVMTAAGAAGIVLSRPRRPKGAPT